MIYKNILWLFIPFLFICDGCTDEEKVTPLFSKLAATETNINFENSIVNTEDLNIFEYRNFYNGGGVGIGDINNDGLSDVIFTANQGDNKIYLNEGDFKFKDITQAAGFSGKNKWSTGVVLVDINGDSWLDIYVCNAGIVSGDNQKNELYINNQDLTFTEAAEQYNLADNGFSTHAAFFDYDKDGDLDVYILNNSFVPVSSLGYSNKRELRSEDWKVKDILKGGGDKLYRNDDSRFVDVSEEAGIYGSLIGFGLGITLGDVNNDNWPDLYVSNDFFERDYLYINQKDGTFSEEIEQWTSHVSLSSMGADLSDINNDGYPDIFVTDMLVEAEDRRKETSEFERYDLLKLKMSKGLHKQYMQNTLQLNNTNQSFSEIAYYSGVAMSDWSWGALVFDMDNDGYKDIFVSNGIYHDVTNQDFINFFANDIIDEYIATGEKMPVDSIISIIPSNPVANYAFKNNGDLTFQNAANKWGLSTPSFSNGTAIGDLDNDGDQDMVINNVNQTAFIYKNETNNQSPQNYIQLTFKGEGKNTFGIGSKVNVYLGQEIIHQQLQPSRGFQSSIDYVMTIGIGNQTKIDSILVTWPDDRQEVLSNPTINQRIVFSQKNAGKTHLSLPLPGKILLEKTAVTPFKKQEEDNFVDYNEEGLIYKMTSKEGPVIVARDIDKDGLEDLFIGGARKQAGEIFLQKENGFVPIASDAIKADADFEDTAAAFFDANEDGLVDLMVGAGGNQNTNRFNLRLYLNDGQGDFQKSELQLPKNIYNTAIITPYDFDLDGDMDVFVGSRSIPGLYGMNPKHFLLENDGLGNFSNVLKEKAPELANAGMVTDAQWKDIDKDEVDDLIITQEWGSPLIFLNKEGILTSLNSGLEELNGWWKTVKAEDVDQDGDIDLVLGNRGTNSIYKVGGEQLSKMYLNDFDNNGKAEQIFTTTFNGKDVPIHLKKELTEQIPALKKNNLAYSEYSKKTIQDLIPEKRLERSIKKSVNIAESVIAFNNGDQTFTIQKLPAQAQFSCINDLEIIDLNADGYLDIIFGGNDYSLKPQFSQLDANYGGVLLGDGKGEFEWMNYSDSGFFVKGVINAIEIVRTGKNISIIVGVNDEVPQLYGIAPISNATN